MDFDEFLKKYNAVEELEKQNAIESDLGRQRKRKREEESEGLDTNSASVIAASHVASDFGSDLVEADAADSGTDNGTCAPTHDAEDRKALVTALLDYIGTYRSDPAESKASKQQTTLGRPRAQSLLYVVSSLSSDEAVEVRTKATPRAPDELARLSSLAEFDLPTVLISQKIVEALVGKQAQVQAQQAQQGSGEHRSKGQESSKNTNSVQSSASMDEDNLDELLAL